MWLQSFRTSTMLAHRIETTVNQDGTVTLANLPFQPGEAVEVIILAQPSAGVEQNRYPLRGTTIQYINPLEPVASEDWGAIA